MFALLVLAVVALAVGIGYHFSAPRFVGPVTDHFDGTSFLNRQPIHKHTLSDFLSILFTETRPEWVEWTENRAYPPPPGRVGAGELQVTFVNHSTVLLQMDGLNVLTDPIWSDRCSPVSFAGPLRRRAPGLEFDALPRIDAVLISHNHYDHLDLPTLRELDRKHSPRFITGLGNGALLRREGIGNVFEMDWDTTLALNEDVLVHGLPARHFSNRGFFDRMSTLWMSFLIEGPAGAVYFAGDTGFGTHFQEIGERFGPIRVALLPIGAFLPRWFMKDVHISPEEAVEAHRLLRAETSMAIHHGTFRLGMDGQTEPAEELNRALDAAPGLRPRFWVLGFGESRAVPLVSSEN